MRYAFFLGCWIHSELYPLEMATREVLPRFGVELVDVPGFSCCGYPLRSMNVASMLYLSSRNIALAEAEGLDLFPLCNGCHASISEVKHILDNDPEIRGRINDELSIEGLRYRGTARIRHILQVLSEDVGAEKISASVDRRMRGFRVAPHYGCHAIRPSFVGRPEDAEDPKVLDGLVRAIGATVEYYPERLDCCGSSLGVADIEAALRVAGRKLQAISVNGFDAATTVCPFCYKMLDGRQDVAKKVVGDMGISVPVFYFMQLLGLAMGIEPRRLGLHLNQSPVDKAIAKMEAVVS